MTYDRVTRLTGADRAKHDLGRFMPAGRLAGLATLPFTAFAEIGSAVAFGLPLDPVAGALGAADRALSTSVRGCGAHIGSLT